jgi:hypothetical protein
MGEEENRREKGNDLPGDYGNAWRGDGTGLCANRKAYGGCFQRLAYDEGRELPSRGRLDEAGFSWHGLDADGEWRSEGGKQEQPD